jgi:ubiquinone/menaquinone biosynthesis C-methylase UbiE
MPTINANKAKWDGKYAWTNRGDEWSIAWGGPFMQWYGMILPRIHPWIPTGTILEIACGYGRWTQFLKDFCNDLIVIDLSEECIQACRQRFSDYQHITYFVNDGRSLDMVSDASVDFIFSFDSLVHADESIMKAYISQLQRILKKNGAVFFHHSNLGEYSYYLKIQKFPKIQRILTYLGILEKNLHWRDSSVTAHKVEMLAVNYGLKCISQEMVTWGTKRALIDCMSTMVKKNSSFSRDNRTLRNARFMEEARCLSQLTQLYHLSK